MSDDPGRWGAALQGAARIGRAGVYRGHCRCERGTCRRCLVRLGLVAPTARETARVERLQALASEALDAAAVAIVEGRPLDATPHVADAIVAHEGAIALGVRR